MRGATIRHKRHKNIIDLSKVYDTYVLSEQAKDSHMARAPGVKNKTPQELKLEASILKKKADIKIDEAKRKALQTARQPKKPSKA